MNRWISNIVLGFFVLILVTAYGIAKQPSVFSQTGQNSNNWVQVAQRESQPAATDAGLVEAQNSEQPRNSKIVLPNGSELTAEIVDTPETRQRGLSGREEFAEGQAMLFVFDEAGEHGIWMKDMKFSIDIVWLDEQGKVVHIEDRVSAPEGDETSLPTYYSQAPAKYVVELMAGVADINRLQIGDQLTLVS
jgi:uncharacterized protein